MSINKWDKRFLELAKLISTWSKDPGMKCGAVIVDKNGRSVISMGYNGLPMKVKDSNKRLKNRDLKLKITLHSEDNAILFSHGDLLGCTIYVYPCLPCSNCAIKIIQKGISKVVTPDFIPEKWKDNIKLACDLFDEVGVKVVRRKFA